MFQIRIRFMQIGIQPKILLRFWARMQGANRMRIRANLLEIFDDNKYEYVDIFTFLQLKARLHTLVFDQIRKIRK